MLFLRYRAMVSPRLFCALLSLVADQVLANPCKEKMQDGVLRSEINGDRGYLSTASVAFEPSVKDSSFVDSFMDAAELKARRVLSGSIPANFLGPNGSDLSGVVALAKCVRSGRAYAKVWLSDRSLKVAKEQNRAISDSLAKNPTPKPTNSSPSLLDEDHVGSFGPHKPSRPMDPLELMESL